MLVAGPRSPVDPPREAYLASIAAVVVGVEVGQPMSRSIPRTIDPTSWMASLLARYGVIKALAEAAGEGCSSRWLKLLPSSNTVGEYSRGRALPLPAMAFVPLQNRPPAPPRSSDPSAVEPCG